VACGSWLPVRLTRDRSYSYGTWILRYQSSINTSYTFAIHHFLESTTMQVASIALASPTQNCPDTHLFLPFDMTSSSDPKPSKRRVGRRRLPPLAPGPSLQFVVANHPDDFRAGRTMRHVRSHVMYKHREHRASSDPDTVRSRKGTRRSSA
jgi:hypothetical protein